MTVFLKDNPLARLAPCASEAGPSCCSPLSMWVLTCHAQGARRHPKHGRRLPGEPHPEGGSPHACTQLVRPGVGSPGLRDAGVLVRRPQVGRRVSGAGDPGGACLLGPGRLLTAWHRAYGPGVWAVSTALFERCAVHGPMRRVPRLVCAGELVLSAVPVRGLYRRAARVTCQLAWWAPAGTAAPRRRRPTSTKTHSRQNLEPRLLPTGLDLVPFDRHAILSLARHGRSHCRC